MNDPAQTSVKPDGQANSQQPSEQPANGKSAWAFDPRTLGMIALSTIIIVTLIALASAIDLPESNDSLSSGPGGLDGSALGDQFSGNEQGGGAGSGGAGSGGAGSGGAGSGGAGSGGFNDGFSGSGRIELGTGDELGVRPIPGCPGGFAFGDVLIVPDPEACGMTRVPPGGQGQNGSGQQILVPDAEGDIGGFRLGPDGQVEFLKPGDIGPSDFAIGQLDDGTFGLFRGDGTWVEITPGDDGLYLQDPFSGGSQFIPGPGAGQFAQPDPDNPTFQPDFDPPDPEQDNGESNPWLVPALITVLILALLALVLLGLRRPKSDASEDDDANDDESDVQETLVDYSAEISALDRMLWEIDQEPDPRTAIRRVYAALETGLENPEMARRVAETPGLYLRRVLGRFDVLHAPLQELTDLFEQARFSEHEITPAMRDRAVHALIAVRTHYAQAATQPINEPEPVPQMVGP